MVLGTSRTRKHELKALESGVAISDVLTSNLTFASEKFLMSVVSATSLMLTGHVVFVFHISFLFRMKIS